jgi:hypothetical protein
LDWWFPNGEIFFSLFEVGVEAGSRGQSRSVVEKSGQARVRNIETVNSAPNRKKIEKRK